ncbi:hypothetical protein ACFQS2_08890 [Brachybacterium sp. GCM10030267]|uniref:hypothetical protein n=1 Tax=Brachybacterium sp. GCM10030267 TaxID=3273381 RepID=UPI00360EE224
MGQPPHTGHGGVPTGGQMPPPEAAGPQQGRRTGMWVMLGCAGLVIVLLLLAVTGGVIYLATQRRDHGSGTETTAAQAQRLEEETFSLEYPAGWVAGEVTSEEAETGLLIQLRDEEIDEEDYEAYAGNSLDVYLFSSDLHAQAECQQQSAFLGFSWDETGDATEIDPVELDGQELVAYRATGTHEDQDVVSETYCADVGDQVMQIVVETYGSTEISPELRQILESWAWA